MLPLLPQNPYLTSLIDLTIPKGFPAEKLILCIVSSVMAAASRHELLLTTLVTGLASVWMLAVLLPVV